MHRDGEPSSFENGAGRWRKGFSGNTYFYIASSHALKIAFFGINYAKGSHERSRLVEDVASHVIVGES